MEKGKRIAPAHMDKKRKRDALKSFMAYAMDRKDRIENMRKELSVFARQNESEGFWFFAAMQLENLNCQAKAVDKMTEGIKELREANTFEKEKRCLNLIIEVQEEVIDYGKKVYDRFEWFCKNFEREQGLKKLFLSAPTMVIEAMGCEYPQLKQLTAAKVGYLVQNEYARGEFARILGKDPKQFVDLLCERASQLGKKEARSNTSFARLQKSGSDIAMTMAAVKRKIENIRAAAKKDPGGRRLAHDGRKNTRKIEK